MKLEEAIVVLNNLTNKDFIELIKKYIDKKAINKLATFSGDTEKLEMYLDTLYKKIVYPIKFFLNI
jgi:hypothetical protein